MLISKLTFGVLLTAGAGLNTTQSVAPPMVTAGLRLPGAGTVAAMAFDADSNAYLAGVTSNPNFPTTYGAYDRTCGSDARCGATFQGSPSSHLVVVKIAPDRTVTYSTFIGGDGVLDPKAIALGPDRSVYVAGEFRANRFPVVRQFPLTRPFVRACGDDDAFVLKLDPSGAALIYATCIQGPSEQGLMRVFGFAVDEGGGAVVGGYAFHNPNFPVVNALQPVYTGAPSFVTRFHPNGEVAFNTFFGGSVGDIIWSLAVDRNGDIFLGGSATSPDLPLSRPMQNALRGATDGFVAKLHRSGRSLLFSTYFGGTHTDDIWSVAVARNGDAWVAGDTHSIDFPTTGDALRSRSLCAGDPGCGNRNPSAFASRFDADGRLRYSTLIGPSHFDPAEPGGARINTVLVGPYDELQLIASASGDMDLVRPLTPRNCAGFACGLLMTIGPLGDIRFASRLEVRNNLVSFAGPPARAALGRNGELYLMAPAADPRATEILRIDVHQPDVRHPLQ